MKFSGMCFLTKEGEFENFSDDTLVFEYSYGDNDIEFDYHIIDLIKKEYDKLEDGQYHVYFEGKAEFAESYSYEYNTTDYDINIYLTYSNFEKLE